MQDHGGDQEIYHAFDDALLPAFLRGTTRRGNRELLSTGFRLSMSEPRGRRARTSAPPHAAPP